jgi:hypothetical protein
MPRWWPRGRGFNVAAWVALALLGLVVAAAVSLAANTLARQHIGLSSEPLTANPGLVPRHHAAHDPRPLPRPPATPPATGGDDSGGDD